MDEETKDKLKKGAKITAHGIGDVAQVAEHVIAGTVKGAADGIEAVSEHHRKEGEDED